MRTLSRRLRLPRTTDRTPDDLTCALLLPRRSTRVLYAILAVVVGVGAGLLYAHYVLTDAGVLWFVATAAVGAVLGAIFVLMPAIVLRVGRRLLTRLALTRRMAALQRGLARTDREVQSELDDDADDPELWNALGIVRLLRGDAKEATEALEHAREMDGHPYAPNLAAALAEARDVSAAADLLAKAAGTEQTTDAAQHNIGVLLARNPAESSLEEVLAKLDEPSSPALLNSLGARALSRDDLELAQRYFEHAVEEDPSAVGPRANLAIIAHRRGDVREAIRRLDEAAALDPTDAALANDLGALLSAAGQPELAIRQLGRAALLAPQSPAVDLNRAVARLELGRCDEALEGLNDARVRDAYPTEAAHDAALALIGLDRREAAAEELDEALEREPSDVGLRNNRACIAWADGDEDTMIEHLSRAAADGADPSAMLNVAWARIGGGDTEGALQILERLADNDELETDVRLLRGLARMANALRHFRRDLSRDGRQAFFRELHRCLRPLQVVAEGDSDRSLEAEANLALYHYLRQEYDRAVEGFLEAASRAEEDGFWQFAAGTVLLEWAAAEQRSHAEEGDELVGQARTLMQRARRHLDAAADRDLVTADLFCNLGICAYDLGDVEGAKMALRRMVQIEESPDAMNMLAIVHGREAQELQHQARAAGLASQMREREMLQDAQAQISTALHYFSKALEHQPDDPVLHGNLGLAHMLRNREQDVELALAHWQRMLAHGGAEERKRYEELTALAHEEGARAQFDETIMQFRPLDPRMCMTAPPPRLSGPRYALQTVDEATDWRLVTSHPRVEQMLRTRDRILGLRQRMARLSM